MATCSKCGDTVAAGQDLCATCRAIAFLKKPVIPSQPQTPQQAQPVPAPTIKRSMGDFTAGILTQPGYVQGRKPATFRYCRSCGERVSAEAKSCLSCGISMPPIGAKK